MMLMEKYRSTCPTYADTAACRDRSVPPDGDASDAGVDVAYPSIPAVAENNYTYALSGQSATGYVITATRKSTFSDPKCGNFVITVAAGAATKTMSSGDTTYCWRN